VKARHRGSALIEFAFAFAVLTPLVAGFVQHGYAIWLHADLQSAVRAGARHAASRSREGDFQNDVRQVVLSFRAAPGLAPEHVKVYIEKEVPCRVTVAIDGYRLPAILGDVTFRGSPRATFPCLVE